MVTEDNSDAERIYQEEKEKLTVEVTANRRVLHLPVLRPVLKGGGLQASLGGVFLGGGEALLQRGNLGLVALGLFGKSSLEVGVVAALQCLNLGAQLGEGLFPRLKLGQVVLLRILDLLQLGGDLG